MRKRIKKFYCKLRNKARFNLRQTLKWAGLAVRYGDKRSASETSLISKGRQTGKSFNQALQSKLIYLKNRSLQALTRWHRSEKPCSIELKLKDILKDNPGSVAAIMKLANYYRNRAEYRKADRLYRRALKHEPDNNLILMEYAKNAFVQGYWKDGLLRYEQFFKKIEGKNIKDNRELLKIWLEANKKKSNILQRLKRHVDLKRQKKNVFETLNGYRDLKEVIRKGISASWQGDKKDVETEIFPRGLASFYVCLHRCKVEGSDIYIVEKCSPATSREQLLYRLIREHCLFTGTRYAGVPRLLGIIDGEQYLKLYLSHVAGKKVSLQQVNHYNYGFALGEIAGEFSALPPEDKFRFKTLRYVDLRRIEANLARFIDYNGFRHIMKALEQYNENLDSLAETKKALPRVFSHNDINLGNVFYQDDGRVERFNFLDWEKAFYNAAGSDLGGLIKRGALEQIEGEEQKAVEKASREGYYDSVSGVYPAVNREELEFAANLAFVDRNKNVAMRNRDLLLFREMGIRIRWLLLYI